MKLYLHDNKIGLSFRYDARLVEVVRSLPGRSFDRSKKLWCVPLIHGPMVFEKLKVWNFAIDPELARRVEEMGKKSMEKSATLERVKSQTAPFDSPLPLKPFQKIGAAFLHHAERALLGDEPGLGKTIQTLASLDAPRILVLCPASLKDNWANEVKKWTKDSVLVVGGKKEERATQWNAPARYHIANYELLLHDWSIVSSIKWDAIVCDECTRVVNAQSKTVRALKKIDAKIRIALSGTPVSNSPLDVWSIIDWFSPGYLGTYPQFFEHYAKTNYYGQVVGYQHIDELKVLLETFVLRRTKGEVLKDLPPKTVSNIVFDLSEDEKKIYNGIKKELWAEIGPALDKIDKQSLAMAPVKMLRLKQVTNDPRLIGTQQTGLSSKNKALLEILKPVLDSGEKAIVFTQFAQMADILLEDTDWTCIQGSTKTEDRQRIVDEFNAKEGAAVLVMTEAGAYGLNIQAASYIIHFDAPWSIAKLEQREGRAHRMGQTKPVTVYNLIAKGTIDEYVASVLHRKSVNANEVLGDSIRLAAEGISEEDIKSILRI